MSQRACPKYKVIEKIDNGSFGDVFKVTNYTGEIFAMKQVLYLGDPKKDPFIKAEIMGLKRLRHERIITLYDVIISATEVNFILEYAESGNLEMFLKNNHPLSEKLLWKFCHQLTESIDICHSHGIVHKDVNPANILVTKKNDVKLADFGLSINLSDMTENGGLCTDYTGHTSYLAPEVLLQEPYDPLLSDVWSLGVVFYFLLHNEPLFQGLPEQVIAQQKCMVAKGILIKVKLSSNGATEFMHNLINRILMSNPKQRLNISALLQMLELAAKPATLSSNQTNS